MDGVPKVVSIQRQQSYKTSFICGVILGITVCYSFYSNVGLMQQTEHRSMRSNLSLEIKMEKPSTSFCQLPSCDLVLKSRLYSQRCGSNESGWPLLITATPRSATVYTRSLLNNHGMSVADDWSPHVRDARVSWIHAVADPNNYGPPYTRTNLTFTHVLHQMRDPLQGITSMCTENVYYMKRFLERHVNFTIPVDEQGNYKPQIVLEWWVAWHSFLSDLKLPTYQIETVQARDIFRMAGLEHLYHEHETKMTTNSNQRSHRQYFSWQELFTIDPSFAAKAWKLAHRLGYSYPEVDFDSLTCLQELPLCSKFEQTNDDNDDVPVEVTRRPSLKCPPGTHPIPNIGNISPSNVVNGWVSGSCVEHKQADGTFVGLANVKSGENITLTAPYTPKGSADIHYKSSFDIQNLTALQEQDHCVIHVHGFHHSGTGFLRKTIYEGLGQQVASIHENTAFPEDEGQFLQNVYFRLDTRIQSPRYCWQESDATTQSVGVEYYCPSLLPIAKQKDRSQKLKIQWSSYWNMSKPFLIQKTPTFDVLFLEKIKFYKTVHAIVMRHPFACQPEIRKPNHVNMGFFAASVWLLNWAHILEIVASGQVKSFAIVRFETLVPRHDEVSKELSNLIQNECGFIPVDPIDSSTRRRLHLHDGKANASAYLMGRSQKRFSELCKQDKTCQRFMDEAEPVMAQLGYNWNANASFVAEPSIMNDSKLLFTPSKLPPKDLVKQIRDLATKYRISYT
jgi:hypothetical protein